MKATELIKKLQQVSPETEVTLATADGAKHIVNVLTNGYTGGRATIVTED